MVLAGVAVLVRADAEIAAAVGAELVLKEATPEAAAHSDEGLAEGRARALADVPMVVPCEALALARVLGPEPVDARVGGRADAVLAWALLRAAVDVPADDHLDETAQGRELALVPVPSVGVRLVSPAHVAPRCCLTVPGWGSSAFLSLVPFGD